MLQTKVKKISLQSINASFSNKQQDALSKLMRDQFMEATQPASEEDIRAKIYDEQEVRTLENIID